MLGTQYGPVRTRFLLFKGPDFQFYGPESGRWNTLKSLTLRNN